ncbi:putative protein phosphatase 2C 54 [Capsicum baccatum]|uniref:protein-serine/threonine phosphatase n=1 Tax=Capsicum baccatum TaxID=33114 RepID=A0A2G2WA65_CAPBA|nr:putative protein phosphatase 2C 54 [Capsicum baccatum]
MVHHFLDTMRWSMRWSMRYMLQSGRTEHAAHAHLGHSAILTRLIKGVLDDSTVGNFPLKELKKLSPMPTKEVTGCIRSVSLIDDVSSGEWSDIGGRRDIEDTHICIADMAKNFGHSIRGEESISFYGVFDGHGGKGAALFVHDC